MRFDLRPGGCKMEGEIERQRDEEMESRRDKVAERWGNRKMCGIMGHCTRPF